MFPFLLPQYSLSVSLSLPLMIDTALVEDSLKHLPMMLLMQTSSNHRIKFVQYWLDKRPDRYAIASTVSQHYAVRVPITDSLLQHRDPSSTAFTETLRPPGTLNINVVAIAALAE